MLFSNTNQVFSVYHDNNRFRVRTYGDPPPHYRITIIEELERCYRKIGQPPHPPEILIIDTEENLFNFFKQEENRLSKLNGTQISNMLPESSVMHFAWRGWPTIVICVERMENRPKRVAIAELERAAAHSVLHGTPECYMIPLPPSFMSLQTNGFFCETTLGLCFYILAAGVKDFEVTRKLIISDERFRRNQEQLYIFLLRMSDEECELWRLAGCNIDLCAVMLADTFKTLAGATPLVINGCSKELMELYEKNISVLPYGLRHEMYLVLLGRLPSLGYNTIKNVNMIAEEFVQLLQRYMSGHIFLF